MYIPRVRDRVEIEGRRGVFLIVSVDEEKQLADVVSLASSAFLEESVAIEAIRPCRENVPGTDKANH